MQHRPSLRRLGSAFVLTGAVALLGSACNVTITSEVDSCGGFEDETRADGAAMVVRNDSDVVVYLSSQDCDPTIDPAIHRDGSRLVTEDLSCSATCEELQTQTQVVCDAACAAPTIIALSPGGTYPLNWSGKIFEQREMPEACFFDDLGGTACSQSTAAPDGAYTASIEVFGMLACPEQVDCECTPNADGYCQVQNVFDVPPSPVEIATDFSLPAVDTVVLSIPGPVSCPATPPDNGTPCGNPGLRCEWDERDACGHELDPEASCESDGRWLLTVNAVLCELECPELTPSVGAACQPESHGTYCIYDGPDACGALRGCNSTSSTWDAIPCDDE